VKASGDHEVEHEIEVPLQADDDSLPSAAQRGDDLTFDFGNGRGDASEQKGSADSHTLQSLVKQPRLQRLEVDLNVGELRHRGAW
jgi:hypothetical protein